MASFTDTHIPQFNPYVQELPVEAMVAVGMQKQKSYEEGVQKIQTQIDNIAGLDVVKDKHKAYLQSKLNELGNKLRTVSAGDFSNFQLVNSVGGMTKQLINDDVIKNAVSSTARLRKEQAYMEEERKKGTLTPDNALFFNKQVNSWMNDEDINNPFTGKYVDYFDVMKFAKETFDAVKPDNMTFDEIYIKDGNGNYAKDAKGNLIYSPAMMRMEKEGIFPEKVKRTLDQIFADPRVNQQLNISGQYNYRNYDSPDLIKKVSIQKDELVANYNEKLLALNQDKIMGKDVQDEIDKVNIQLSTTLTNYAELEKMAVSSPDTVRGMLYRDDVNNNYTTMFGQIKSKTLAMENPYWRSQFEIQKELNAQSRFAQELHQKKLDRADANKWKGLEYEQRERFKNIDVDLATKKLAGKAKPGATDAEGRGYEQGDQPADIDVLTIQANNYDNAAKGLDSAQNDFIWKTTLGGFGDNEQVLQKMVNGGMDRDAAMDLMIKNAAKANKVNPEDFKATWLSRGIVKYNNMSPAEKANNPILADAYGNYSNAKQTFKSEQGIKKGIDQAMGQTYAKVAGDISLDNIKPQKVNLYGKQYELSKENIKDMALYLAGKESILGFIQDDNVRLMGKAAEKRLIQDGKGEFLDPLIRNKGVTTAGPITAAARIALGTVGNITDMFRSNSGEDVDFSQVMKIHKMISNKTYADALTKKADIIKRAYNITPNMKVGLVTGDPKIDKPMFADMKRMAGAYTAGQKQNLSPDFSSFASSLGESLEKSNVEATVIMDANQNPMVELVSYDDNGNRVGGMTIQPDEAAKFGVDVSNLYESKDISMLRNKMNFNNNKSCNGPIKEKATYLNGDYEYGKNKIPGLKGSTYDAKVNFQYSNGKYYPFLYVSDGQTSKVLELAGDPSLSKLDAAIKTSVNPSLIKKFLIEK